MNFQFLIIISIINLYSLISNDVKHIWLNKNADIYLDIVQLIILFYFIIEIIIFSFLDEIYLYSLSFWIDAFGTLFIFLNVEFITDYMFGYNNISHNSSNAINGFIEYLSICIAMFERLVRILKIIK